MTIYGFVSTFPPTQCGLATFTASLSTALRTDADEVRIVRSVEQPSLVPFPDGVVAELVAGDVGSHAGVVEALDGCDVVFLQHEYGIYGGPDGDEVLAVMEAVRTPIISVLHTVLTSPTEHQHDVLEAVVRASAAVVVMSETAHRRLRDGYTVDMAQVQMVPHGAREVIHDAGTATRPAGAPRATHSPRPLVLTWGLIGRGKGIEHGIAAMALLKDLDPRPRYVVAGQTHPKVLLREGEAYRESLQRQVDELGMGDMVELEADYLDAPALSALIASADVVLLPYDSTDQVTSGVLIEAVVATVPVVATRFPHAVELLANGSGVVVPQKDAVAMAQALREVLTHDDVAAAMTRAADASAAALLWPAVADRYRSIVASLVPAGQAA